MSRSWSLTRVHLRPNFGRRGGGMGGMFCQRWNHSKGDGGLLYTLHCDHCAICNHSATICHRMSPTLKSTDVGHFGTKFEEEEVDRCKTNSRDMGEHEAVVC